MFLERSSNVTQRFPSRSTLLASTCLLVPAHRMASLLSSSHPAAGSHWRMQALSSRCDRGYFSPSGRRADFLNARRLLINWIFQKVGSILPKPAYAKQDVKYRRSQIQTSNLSTRWNGCCSFCYLHRSPAHNIPILYRNANASALSASWYCG